MGQVVGLSDAISNSNREVDPPGELVYGRAYRSGLRSAAWLKVKHRLTLRVQVPGGSLAPSNGVIGAGAARVQLAYTHPCTDALTTIEEPVRVS